MIGKHITARRCRFYTSPFHPTHYYHTQVQIEYYFSVPPPVKPEYCHWTIDEHSFFYNYDFSNISVYASQSILLPHLGVAAEYMEPLCVEMGDLLELI